MEKFSLCAMGREQLEHAAAHTARRSATTVYGGHEHRLRQTVIALTAGAALAEHDNSGEATVVVLSGRIRLRSAHAAWDGRRGDLLVVPRAPHSLEALEDSAILLTTAK